MLCRPQQEPIITAGAADGEAAADAEMFVTLLHQDLVVLRASLWKGGVTAEADPGRPAGDEAAARSVFRLHTKMCETQQPGGRPAQEDHVPALQPADRSGGAATENRLGWLLITILPFKVLDGTCLHPAGGSNEGVTDY